MWLDACIGSWQNDTVPVKAFLDSGGNRSRRLLDGEASALNQQFPGAFSAGLDLINIALQKDSQDVLRLVLPAEAMAPAPVAVDMRKLWLDACRSCMNSDLAPIRHFLDAGGSPTRRLLGSEAKELSRTLPGCFQEGETLANLALKWDNHAVLSCVLDAVDGHDRQHQTATHRGTSEEEGQCEGVGRMAEGEREIGRDGGEGGQGGSGGGQMSIPAGVGHVAVLDRQVHGVSVGGEVSGGGPEASMWRQACLGAYQNSSNPIVAFLESGGDRARRLTGAEVQALSGWGRFHVGETLADIALRSESYKALAAAIGEEVPPSKRQALGDVAVGTVAAAEDVSGEVKLQWVAACVGAAGGLEEDVSRFLEAGGQVSRRLDIADAATVNARLSTMLPASDGRMVRRGESLVDIALKFDRQEILKALCPDEKPEGALKRLPSHAFPTEASAISKQVALCMEDAFSGAADLPFLQTTFALPHEIQAFPDPLRRQILAEIVDVDARGTLEEEREPVINWSPSLLVHSRLHPLYNGGMGDCLLHSAALATNGVEDGDLSLRNALTRVLRTINLYPRWREARAREAAMNGYRADDWQWRREWAELGRAAQMPRSSLEQTHVWALTHVLRRPIIMYGVHSIKNYRNEVVGLAQHQGIYLPFMLEKSQCSTNPVALGYVRGHYVALVGEEKDASGAASVMLPVTTPDGELLPVHFLRDAEVGREAALVREWLPCRSLDGVLCAEQRCDPRMQRPEACQALMSRYTEELRRRFAAKATEDTDGESRQTLRNEATD